MSNLIRKLLVVVMMGALSTGAFAQGRGKDKRPPKEPVKIRDGKGGSNRPPQPPPPQKPKDDRGGKKRP
jgi:hypothetical protein